MDRSLNIGVQIAIEFAKVRLCKQRNSFSEGERSVEFAFHSSQQPEPIIRYFEQCLARPFRLMCPRKGDIRRSRKWTGFLKISVIIIFFK